MYKEEHLISNAGIVSDFGIKITTSYDSMMSIDPNTLNDLIYRHKLVLVRGMGERTVEEFWNLSNRFGGGAWKHTDYNVGKESCIHINDLKTKSLAIYDNVGETAKAIGDGEMSWHVDIPLWLEYQLPMRAFYAVSIPDNKYGVTQFSSRSYPILKLSPEEKTELKKWRLLYQSWYEPGTSLTYIPVITKHPILDEEYLTFTSFNNSLRPYSHESYNWKVHGWIFGAEREGIPYNSDIVSHLHKLTLVPENIYNHHWEEQDFLIYANMSTIHARTNLRSDLQTKPRSFFRMNVFNQWQGEYNVF